MKTLTHSLASFVVGSVAIILFATGVLAQTSPPPEPAGTEADNDIEEIIVQAGESESAADLDAGDSVTGFDASDLEALGAQSIEDLAGFTPNLEIVTSGSTTPTFFIRGVGLNDFGANSTGAVSIYQDDVPKNSPALQLGTLFDMEAVNILRGPQGTGPFRNASAGAIKLYARKPTGEFGGFLRSEIGNYDARDFEGAVEMPLYEDILSTRLSFRFSQRDGYAENRCGGAPPFDQRPQNTAPGRDSRLISRGGTSVCGEFNRFSRFGIPPSDDGISDILPGMEEDVNNRDNWAARGMLRFQPTLDQDWLLGVNIGKRDELPRVGQSIGTSSRSDTCDLDLQLAFRRPECKQTQTFGTPDGEGYRPIELVDQANTLNECRNPDGSDNGTCTTGLERRNAEDAADFAVAGSLGDLDKYPHEGDYNREGEVTNDTLGISLKGTIAIGDSLTLTTVTGYDEYDRKNDVDLDFTPNVLFEIDTEDDGWQVVQDLALSGVLSQEVPVGWEIGGFGLIEELDVGQDIFLPPATRTFGVSRREYTQDLYSLAGYVSFDWDFWEDFTLDGGVRYQWENKKIDLIAFTPSGIRPFEEEDTWQEPTGQIRLTYRFREDTHAYMKYTRGFKGGHFNATVSPETGITTADPENIDSFEGGLRGSWFNGRLGLDASIFHYAYENYQLFTIEIPRSGPAEFVVKNANDAEVYGAELDLTARPLPGLFLQGRFSWLESEFLDFVQTQATSAQVGNQRLDFIRELDFSGNRLLNSPQFKVSLTVEQTVPLGRFGSLTGRWDGAWTDDTYFDASQGVGSPTLEGVTFLPTDTIGQSAYWLHNLALTYRTPDGAVSLTGWVRNVDDQVYKTFGFDASALTINRTTIFFVGEPRTYGMSLTATF